MQLLSLELPRKRFNQPDINLFSLNRNQNNNFSLSDPV